ncbi:MAG: hypothetical protein FJX42_02905, partial [Alphaproteobacteria bacterium]|nr:hypothetical protein [Alphaproteobacteria bacterium]
MTRIATYASNTLLLNYISGTNNRLQDEQIQLTTGKVSQTYQGISASSQRLITFENTHASLDQFMKNNTTAEIRLDLTATALEGIRDTIRDFEEELQRYQSSAVKDRNANNQLQSAAFRGLLSMVSYMNTQADGRYIFAGGRTDVPPADLTVSTLAAFQAAYNGSTVTFPTTRDANLENFSISADGDNYSNWLTFARSNGASPPLGRITATTAQFANVNVGAKITVSGTTSNNGTYTVKAVDAAGKYIDIVTEMLTDETSAPISVTYPDPNQANVTLSVSGTATFSRSGDTITYGSGTMADIPVGSAFTVAGSTNNNGTYTVASNSGGVITIVSKKLTDEGTTAAFQNTAAANVTFTNVGAAGTDTIAFPAGAIAALPATPAVGSTFKITGAGTYDGTYTVKSIAGDTITVDENITATSTLTDNAITAVFGPVAYFQKSVDTTANTLTFTNNTAPTKGTIASTIAGFFDTLKSGMRIKLTGSSSTNGDNDTYTIDSVSSDGKTITIKEDLPAATVTDTTDM